MAEQTFAQRTLDKLLKAIEVEFKVPLGIAEVKFSPTEIAKEWRENQKKRSDLENAIRRAEDKFIADYKDQKVAQILHELPLYSEEEFQKIVAELLTHLSEEKIAWLAEVNLEKTWRSVVSTQEIRKALELYIPYLRHELNSIKEFREVISALTLERIEVSQIRIESKLDQVLELREKKDKDLEFDFWYIPHPYPMPPNFTGRKAELQMLDDWLADSKGRLFILRALGGFGKSALTWQWINTCIKPAEWSKLVWWSFYEGDASFENFVKSTLDYLKLDVPQGTRPQVDELLKAMQSRKILLIMDGFERVLRAYSSINAAYQDDKKTEFEDNRLDCVNINTEVFLKGVCSLPNMNGKALMTTRLTPRAVKSHEEIMLGCQEEELTAMQKEDAVEFFRRQGIKGTYAEIEASCALYGYHPLSLRLVAGRILKDFQNPGDILVAQKLNIDGDLKQHQHHVLEVSYDSLLKREQKLLSIIACFRSPIQLDTVKSFAQNTDSLDNDLHELVERGLLHFDGKNRKFDLHPIVRQYAYQRLTKSDRAAAHNSLIDHFKTASTTVKTDKPEDLAPVIELYYHLVQAGRYEEGLSIFRDRLNDPLYVAGGEYILCIELLEGLLAADEDALSHNDLHAWPWLLNKLALCYNRTGRSHEAESAFKRHIAIREKMEYLPGIAIGLGNLSEVLLRLGRLKEVVRTLERKIDISKQMGDEFKEMAGRQDYGLVLAYQADFEESQKQLKTTIDWLSYMSSSREECISWTFYTILQILQGHVIEALESAKRANELALVERRERDIVRSQWLLGTAYRLNNQLDLAERHLGEALTRDRVINLIEVESPILLDLARLRYDQKSCEEAKSLAQEALSITERCSYVLQGADVNLFLAQYALEQEKEKAKAKDFAETALKLAFCDGPPYCYRVAYEEAQRMLQRLK